MFFMGLIIIAKLNFKIDYQMKYFIRINKLK